jgi:hypothetical protein
MKQKGNRMVFFAGGVVMCICAGGEGGCNWCGMAWVEYATSGVSTHTFRNLH